MTRGVLLLKTNSLWKAQSLEIASDCLDQLGNFISVCVGGDGVANNRQYKFNWRRIKILAIKRRGTRFSAACCQDSQCRSCRCAIRVFGSSLQISSAAATRSHSRAGWFPVAPQKGWVVEEAVGAALFSCDVRLLAQQPLSFFSIDCTNFILKKELHAAGEALKGYCSNYFTLLTPSSLRTQNSLRRRSTLSPPTLFALFAHYEPQQPRSINMEATLLVDVNCLW